MSRIVSGMSDIQHLLTLVDAYCQATRAAETTLSTRVFSDGKRLNAIRAGSDIGVRRFARAMQWFSDNWPEGLDWPADVPHPACAEPAATPSPQPSPRGGEGVCAEAST
ncbi:hypothetical protein [Methylobrevis pamukkalensis]|uniref:Uncharacterized protein n=1 Tax=Methylobrevis pamukkalensis TaxID=1439726 RepID=A0A1E3H1J4_9HYPH|nr:hypothetical protein [Methylobrevis pamukkalensis]ODN70190.1 hypothetical protein A6302_02464 [Methylobrevis pamukkalensis]